MKKNIFATNFFPHILFIILASVFTSLVYIKQSSSFQGQGKEQQGAIAPNNVTSQTNQARVTSKKPQSKFSKNLAYIILKEASQLSGIRIKDLKITKITSTNFANPCIYGFGEICTREYNPIPGWEVTVKVAEEFWTYHTSPKNQLDIILDPKIIKQAITKDANQRSNSQTVEIINLKSQLFNRCNFFFLDNEKCSLKYASNSDTSNSLNNINGWEVNVKLGEKYWTYHITKSGSVMIIDPKAK